MAEEVVSTKELEKKLKQWRETRARKTVQQTAAERRLVRVNGQEVIVITKGRNKTQG
jgi:hypothetical protein